MMTNEEKVQALLNSPAGCVVILEISANLHLPLEHFAQPRVSFWLAANAIQFTDVRSDGNWQEIALREAKPLGDLALSIVSNPAFDWWYEPVDLENQIWSSPLMRNFMYNPDRPEPDPFQPETWRRPGLPDREDDNPLPDTSMQETSTLRDESTSEWTAFSNGAGDHHCAFPLAAWHVRFEQDVRVYEVNHPADWHALCLEFPHREPDGRLVPNWPAVSERWDGVHLTLGGMLSCEQVRYESNGEWSMMQFWHTEITCWLNRLALSGERIPDCPDGHNEWHDLNQYPFDWDELFNAAGPGAFRLTLEQ